MKFLDGSIFDLGHDKKDEKEVMELIKNSQPKVDSKFTFLGIREYAGWGYITAEVDGCEFSVDYSSCMCDASSVIEFFKEIIDLNGELILTLDDEGSYPVLYAESVDEDNIRFLFAHDYDLFANKDINGYTVCDYKIECDIVIGKKELLENFYNIMFPFTENYDLVDVYNSFNLNRVKKYLKAIKKYISN